MGISTSAAKGFSEVTPLPGQEQQLLERTGAAGRDVARESPGGAGDAKDAAHEQTGT